MPIAQCPMPLLRNLLIPILVNAVPMAGFTLGIEGFSKDADVSICFEQLVWIVP